MSTHRVLIVSSHPLFADAIAHVLQSEGIAVAGTARTIHSVEPLIREHRPGTIILDCDETSQPDAKILDILLANGIEAQIVCLSLDSNRMLVHRWQRLGAATPADLISVLRPHALAAPQQGVIA